MSSKIFLFIIIIIPTPLGSAISIARVGGNHKGPFRAYTYTGKEGVIVYVAYQWFDDLAHVLLRHLRHHRVQLHDLLVLSLLQ